jgi:hypothetical protein
MSPFVADIVAKRFWVSDEATLIQDQPAIRKVDSKIFSFRFDCCAQAAPRRFLHNIGPTLPTSAVRKVVGSLEYTGRGLPVVAKAARDPFETFARQKISTVGKRGTSVRQSQR